MHNIQTDASLQKSHMSKVPYSKWISKQQLPPGTSFQM